MISESENLLSLQLWLQRAITAPWEVSEERIEAVVKKGGSLTPAERLAIYSRAYQGRLVECMESEFPVLRLALGRDLFVRFASEYLIRTPSKTYTLSALGKDFPAYLEASAPAESWAGFIVELATLERTFSEIFHSNGFEKEAVDPATDTAEILKEPASRFLDCEFPIDRYFTAVRRHLEDPQHYPEPDIPAPDRVRILLFRRSYTVRMRRIDRSNPDQEQGTRSSAPPYQLD